LAQVRASGLIESCQYVLGEAVALNAASKFNAAATPILLQLRPSRGDGEPDRIVADQYKERGKSWLKRITTGHH
jgi:hypothetical protein